MRIAIFLGILLLVLGGAAGAYFGLGINPFADDEDQEVVVVDPLFLDMRPFIVPLFEGRSVAWHADVGIAIETESEEDFEYVTLHANSLRDAFSLELASYMNLQWSELGEIDPILLKNRLRLVAGKIVGRGYIREVVITELLIRRPGTSL
ncbi:MAG: hypothetical protein AAF684_09625 [Pseudomonadota bacterium]